ncbi:MAG: sugar phosphate nucleotidyltransferase [Anaerolineales bacterium]
MSDTLKIVIPMAGWGTRMRPHTWNKPKPLVSVAGKTSLEHLMDVFETLPEPGRVEYVFIVGPYLGETQIPAFVAEHYPDIKAHYVVQAEMKGQSHALYLARQYLNGPMLMIFSDTLIETDFSFLDREKSNVVAWVKPVPDPRRFGVAEVDARGWVTRFIEKPQSLENNRVVVGCYYFQSGEALMAAIEEQFRRDVQLKNEFFLTDAINIMIETGALVRTEAVDIWLDTGTIDATLETNAYLLERMKAAPESRPAVDVKPPVFIHPMAEVSHATIGPHVSLGAHCKVNQAVIQDSIIEAETEISGVRLTHSLIGRNCVVRGAGEKAGGQAVSLNIGDNSHVRFEA